MRRFDYLLAAFSVAWVALLLLPGATTQKAFCYVTAGLIATNLVVSLGQLIRKGRILILLNLAQIPLFCLLNFQLFSAFGEHHYQFNSYPGVWDWLELTAVHVLRAVDILDGLEAYGIDLQSIHNGSLISGLLLVWMHIAVDIFLITLVIQLVSRLLKQRGDPVRAKKRLAVLHAVRMTGLVVCAVLIVVCAIRQRWGPLDWLLWPLDQTLRTIDVGDAFQIFHWRLHNVSMGFWTVTLAVSFRLLAGIYLGEWIAATRVQILRGRGSTVEQLIAMLDSPNDEVRKAACEGLGNFGPGAEAAVPALCRLLGAEYYVQKAAIKALGQIGSAAAPSLGEALSHEASHVRFAAVELLRKIGPAAEAAVPELSKALTPPRDVLMLSMTESTQEARFRETVARTLGQIGPAAEAAVPALSKALADLDNGVRKAAARVLDDMGVDPLHRVSFLIEALSDEKSLVRYGAARSLGEIGSVTEAVVPALNKALADEDVGVRGQAAEALGQIGPAAEAAVPTLTKMLADEDTSLRKRAARALGQIGPTAEVAVAALTKALADEDALVRHSVTKALDSMRVDPRRRILRLIEALSDENSSVRLGAAMALADIGPAAEPAVAALTKALEDGDTGVRDRAAEALAKIGPAAGPAVAALTKALEDRDTGVRDKAAKALGQIGPAAGPAVAALTKALKQYGVYRAAAQALGKIGLPAEPAVTALSKLLADQDRGAREDAARALDNMHVDPRDRVPGLTEALSDERVDVRDTAVWQLGQIGAAAEPALVALINALEHESSRVRGAAAKALGQIGAAAEPALPALSKALADDEESHVRETAAQALDYVLSGMGVDRRCWLSHVIRALSDENRSIRCKAVQSLGEISATEAVAPALKVLVIPALKKGLADEDADVRATAAGWLNRLRRLKPQDLK